MIRNWFGYILSSVIMLKFGIHDKQQLTRARLQSFFGRRQFIAADLYGILSCFASEERAFFEEAILSRFSLANKTFKLTSAQRFEDFDRRAEVLICARFPGGEKMRIHDMGVSDGRTAVDFYNRLLPHYGVQLDYLASDYGSRLQVVRRQGEDARLVLSAEGVLLQIIWPPFVFNMPHPESALLYPVNFIVRKCVQIFYARPLLAARARGEADVRQEEILLLAATCKDLMAREENFNFTQHNIMEPCDGMYHVVRVMNLLNPGYFENVQLRTALTHIKNALSEGGLFITGSNTHKGMPVKGGIYIKEQNRFCLLQAASAGSPVHDVIMAV